MIRFSHQLTFTEPKIGSAWSAKPATAVFPAAAVFTAAVVFIVALI